ncbi:MAG: YdcF family protein [Planctomycetota bacterium]
MNPVSTTATRKSSGNRILRQALIASFYCGLGLSLIGLVVFFAGGQFLWEKTLKALIAPVGLIWLGLLAQTAIFLRYGQWRSAVSSLLLWLFLTLAGNQLVTYWMVATLEKPFLDTRIDSLGEFDAVLILGGSTGMTPAGEVQGGERVFAGYRLFNSGKVKKLLVSGRQNALASDSDLHPAEEARLQLLQSGVPESAIVVLGGLNTSEEIACLKDWLNANATLGIRIGVLSDASHLERALSLCTSQGIQGVGIPSGFATNPFVPNPSIIIPSSSNLSKTEAFIYEILGRWLGR